MSDSIILDIPSDSLNLLELAGNLDGLSVFIPYDFSLFIPFGSSSLSYVERDLMGEFPIPGVEVDVVGNQKFSCPDHRGPCFRVKNRLTVIRSPFRVLEFFRESLVFSYPDRRQVSSIRFLSSFFIQVNRDVELPSHSFSDFMSKLDTVFHSHTGHGNEGADVSGTNPAVSPCMLAHIQDFGGFFNRFKSSLLDSFRGSDKGDDSPVS